MYNKNIQKRTIITLLLASAFFYQLALGQSKKLPWEELYKDKDITVEIQFTIISDSCGPNSKHKFKYRVTGKYKAYTQYLIWKMNYLSCNGKRYFIQNALLIGMPNGDDITSGMMVENSENYIPGVEQMETPFYDIVVSAREEKSVGILPPKHSVAATSIDGPDQVYWGERLELTVKGGDLGIGAQWVWYEQGCGTKKVGTGPVLRLNSITDSSTYFVRAEGQNNVTRCAWKTIAVDKKSKAAKSIKGNDKICLGDNSTLSVVGGTLGPQAEWVWYADNCNGKRVGTGSSITISPLETTTYFVRAEGPLNTTNCISETIKVLEKSKSPNSIEYNGDHLICAGTRVQLSVKGGKLSNDGTWKWYEGGCGNTYSIGSGNSIIISPTSTQTYFVRAEGGCNTSDCANIQINVESKSILPKRIEQPDFVYKKSKTTLSINGGSLDANAEWVWYEGRCGAGRSVGKGTSITIKPRKPTTYYVKAVGNCQEGNCISTTINPIKVHQMDRTYVAGRKKFFHFGIGLGLDYTTFKDWATYMSSSSSSSEKIQIYGIGMTGDIVLHPIIKEWFTIGVMSSLTAGTTIPSEDNTEDINVNKYYYVRPTLGVEMAIGVKPVKILGNLSRSIQTNSFSADDNSSSGVYSYNRTWNQQTVGLGLRLGGYSSASLTKKKGNFDIFYTLTQDVNLLFIRTSNDFFTNLNQHQPGLSIVWWKQSRFKFKASMVLPVSNEGFQINNIDHKNATYQIGLIFNKNSFY